MPLPESAHVPGVFSAESFPRLRRVVPHSISKNISSGIGSPVFVSFCGTTYVSSLHETVLNETEFTMSFVKTAAAASRRSVLVFSFLFLLFVFLGAKEGGEGSAVTKKQKCRPVQLDAFANCASRVLENREPFSVGLFFLSFFSAPSFLPLYFSFGSKFASRRSCLSLFPNRLPAVLS